MSAQDEKIQMKPPLNGRVRAFKRHYGEKPGRVRQIAQRLSVASGLLNAPGTGLFRPLPNSCARPDKNMDRDGSLPQPR